MAGRKKLSQKRKEDPLKNQYLEILGSHGLHGVSVKFYDRPVKYTYKWVSAGKIDKTFRELSGSQTARTMGPHTVTHRDDPKNSHIRRYESSGGMAVLVKKNGKPNRLVVTSHAIPRKVDVWLGELYPRTKK